MGNTPLLAPLTKNLHDSQWANKLVSSPEEDDSSHQCLHFEQAEGLLMLHLSTVQAFSTEADLLVVAWLNYTGNGDDIHHTLEWWTCLRWSAPAWEHSGGRLISSLTEGSKSTDWRDCFNGTSRIANVLQCVLHVWLEYKNKYKQKRQLRRATSVRTSQ